MRIEIPEEEQKTIARWLIEESEPIDKVLEALEKVQPSLNREGLSRTLAMATELPFDTIDEALRVFFNLLRTVTSAEADDDAIPSVFRAVAGELNDAEKLRRFTERVRRICGSRAAQITSKAVLVLYDNPNTFCEARVLSELRPIFTAGLKAEAALVMHQLKIVFHTGPEMDRDEFFVTLSRNDLDDLKRVIDRALEKHAEIVRVADKIQVLQ